MTTPQSNTQNPESEDGEGEVFRVHGQRSLGFSILYHDTARRLLWEHSAILKTYICLGTFSNAKRESFPSIERLGAMIDMDKRSVYRALSALEDMGLLHISRKPGSVSRYTLLTPDDDGYAVGKGVGSEGGDTHVTPDTHVTGGVTPMSPEQEPTNKTTEDNPPTPLPGEDEDVEVDSVSVQRQSPRDSPNGNRAQSSPSYNQSVQSNGGSEADRERRHPYWQGDKGRERGKSFKALYDKYPKPGDIARAAQAYREVIGERGDSPDGKVHSLFYQELWASVENWMRHWEAERTEARYIPYLENFINKEKWTQVPGVRRR